MQRVSRTAAPSTLGAAAAAGAAWVQARHGNIFWYSDVRELRPRPHTFQPVKFRAHGARSVLKSCYRAAAAPTATKATDAAEDAADAETEEDVRARRDRDEAARAASAAETPLPGADRPGRRYFPLNDVAHVEIRGDFYTEAGMPQQALECYGVCTKAYLAAYPKHHNQVARVFIKLGRAFRATGRLRSAKRNLEEALAIFDAVEQPDVEHVCELLLELGSTKAALGDDDAGVVLEDAHVVLANFHDLGSSHRGLRTLPNASKRFWLHPSSKLEWHGLFDYDRTFAVVDEALAEAERFYNKRGDIASVVRVLEARSQMIDRKFFNARMTAGRLHSHRGRNWMKKFTATSSPSATEVLQWSPTLHQPYFDYALENTAPLGLEHLVPTQANERVVDGDPYRRILEENLDRQKQRGVAVDESLSRWERPATAA